MPFACSICEEESTRICVHCTKDTCSNHLCEKCGCCSDCCNCEVPLEDHTHAEPMYVETVHPPPAQPESEPLHHPEPTPDEIMHVDPPRPDPDPDPEPPHPPPDPDPIPEDGPEPGPGPILG
jgi:hypothetical protein